MSERLIYAAFGKAVAFRRKELKLTQAELAGRVGISRASVANIESGRQKLLLHQVYRFADALDLPSVTALLPLDPKAKEIAEMPIAQTAVRKDELSARERILIGELVATAIAGRTPKAGA